MPKKVELRGLSIGGINTKRKFGADSKVEVHMQVRLEGFSPGKDILAALHDLEDELVNVTLVRVQGRLDDSREE